MDTLIVENTQVYRFTPSQGYQTESRVLFSHATGIAALTYKDVLQRWADACSVDVFAFDARGHADQPQTLRHDVLHHKQGLTSIPSVLCDDLKAIFRRLRMMFPGAWSLAGHSLGGWLSLYAANDIDVERLVLWDMPMLSPSSTLLWAAACLFRQRGIHPLSRPARRRKRLFRSRNQAFNAFKRNSFFSQWSPQHLQNYIDANFTLQNDGTLSLKHDPEWEADLFESQPALHTPLMLKMNAMKRKHLHVELLAGAESKICDATAIRYFHRLFPQTRWFIIPHGGHMFPFENTRGLVETLTLLNKPQSQRQDAEFRKVS